MKKSALLFMAALAITASAQTAEENTTMYLIKGNRVVGKYPVEAVDYASFRLPEGVRDESLWLTVDNVTKNSVTYTVNTIEETTAYAHGIISYYDANYFAMDMYGDNIENLEPEAQQYILRTYLSYVGYLGSGTMTATMTDFTPDGSGGYFSVMPGCEYYLCAWEVDPLTKAPLDTFVYTQFETLQPGVCTADLNVSFLRQNEEGLAFDITGSDDILYVVTAFGQKDVMEMYVSVYGLDFLMGTFGQKYTLSELQGENSVGNGIEAATWPAFKNGEYVLYVRGYDAEGNMKFVSANAAYQAEQAEGPQINILNRSKSQADRNVSLTFEVVPSKVSEAYVRMLPEREVDDMLNDGWYLYEIASSSSAIDIYDEIRATGEYTFTADNLSDSWYSILIYARDTDGARTVQRVSFNILEDSRWADYQPQHANAMRKAKARLIERGHRPTIDRLSK